MNNLALLVQTQASPSLLSELDSRDVAVWLLDSFVDAAGVEEAAKVLALPWAFVLSESTNTALVDALEMSEPVDSPLVRRRGIIHIIDTNPADVTLPPRSLPVFLLNGRAPAQKKGLSAMTRRLTMLEVLRRREIKHLVILCGTDLQLPEELTGLWSDGFKSIITVVSNAPDAKDKLTVWQSTVGAPAVALVAEAPDVFAADLTSRYLVSRSERLILRLRDAKGELHRLDITGLDDPEHPILSHYEMLSEDLLLPLAPEDLRLEEIEGFFKDPRSSWRPYAAGMVWPRVHKALEALKQAMRRLDKGGVENNKIFYVTAESGAGATAFVRDLAWTMSREGYPTLLASPTPFVPSGVEIASYMSRCLEAAVNAGIGEDTRLYEAPWLIVFDRTQWEGREGELISFRRELETSGRRACIIFVTGPYLPLSLFDDRRFRCLAELTHQVSLLEALDLGRHLNRYLARHGSIRTEAEWRNFFDQSAVSDQRGIAAFWITLSFWLQRQFDMGETVQTWLYRQFQEKVSDPVVRQAIIEIAAMSTEHQLLPEAMLPVSSDWPTADKLTDLQKELGALGIVRFSDETRRYWALIHDLLGRYLLNSIFFDYTARSGAGFADASNPEHLRLLVLKRIARKPELGLIDLREVAEAFATSIFKIDPDHGRAIFAPFWREALAALDEMPRALRTTSRTFLHHSAISRRRIAKDADSFPIPDAERAQLLERAISDIESARNISPRDGGDESELNLLNSLAHAYHDLAETQARQGAPAEQIEDLRAKAKQITRQAYTQNPDNSFVIETYARDLLSGALADPEVAPGNAIEVLGIVYSSLQRDAAESRRHALGRIADKAFDILLDLSGRLGNAGERNAESSAIIEALAALGDGIIRFEGMQLSDYPQANRIQAAERLAQPILRGNAQALRLRYLLACLDRPMDFALQLELLDALEGGIGSVTPQYELEHAILLHQRDRHFEASNRFRKLRELWRREEHYVEVPERLRWFRQRDTSERRQVHARVSASGHGRYFAKVRELQDVEAAFRPQEFGQERLRPGMVLNGYISFGHNGPFLRPLTAA